MVCYYLAITLTKDTESVISKRTALYQHFKPHVLTQLVKNTSNLARVITACEKHLKSRTCYHCLWKTSQISHVLSQLVKNTSNLARVITACEKHLKSRTCYHSLWKKTPQISHVLSQLVTNTYISHKRYLYNSRNLIAHNHCTLREHTRSIMLDNQLLFTVRIIRKK